MGPYYVIKQNDKKIVKCMIRVLNDLLHMKVHIWNDQ